MLRPPAGYHQGNNAPPTPPVTVWLSTFQSAGKSDTQALLDALDWAHKQPSSGEVMLLGVLCATIFEFHKVDPLAAQLLLPYLAWTSFATGGAGPPARVDKWDGVWAVGLPVCWLVGQLPRAQQAGAPCAQPRSRPACGPAYLARLVLTPTGSCWVVCMLRSVQACHRQPAVDGTVCVGRRAASPSRLALLRVISGCLASFPGLVLLLAGRRPLPCSAHLQHLAEQ